MKKPSYSCLCITDQAEPACVCLVYFLGSSAVTPAPLNVSLICWMFDSRCEMINDCCLKQKEESGSAVCATSTWESNYRGRCREGNTTNVPSLEQNQLTWQTQGDSFLKLLHSFQCMLPSAQSIFNKRHVFVLLKKKKKKKKLSPVECLLFTLLAKTSPFFSRSFQQCFLQRLLTLTLAVLHS